MLDTARVDLGAMFRSEARHVLLDALMAAGETQEAQELMEASGHDPRRLKMAAICSVCAESFVSHVQKFQTLLNDISTS